MRLEMLLSDLMLLQGSSGESVLLAQGSDVLGPHSPWRHFTPVYSVNAWFVYCRACREGVGDDGKR